MLHYLINNNYYRYIDMQCLAITRVAIIFVIQELVVRHEYYLVISVYSTVHKSQKMWFFQYLNFAENTRYCTFINMVKG